MSEVAARFGRPELEPLWREARRRFENSATPVTRLTLRGLSPAQRSALADLLGLAHTPGPELSIAVARLDAILLASPVGLDTRGVVAALSGPLIDRVGERRRREADRDALWQWLADHPVVTAEPALQAWVAWARGVGLVGGDVERTRQLLDEVLAVIGALPAGGEPLPSYANAVCGDPHALDEGTRLSGYALRALAALHAEDVPADAEARRRLWQRAGVACDDLSTVVIAAGLRPVGEDPLAASLRAWAAAGTAVSITLAQLHAFPLRCPPCEAFVVENPSVVAGALGRLGSDCPPLVCVSGWPNTAVITLLRQLVTSGVDLRYHGDLDGEGVRIAAHVIARTGAAPWRMSREDYLAAMRPDGPPTGRISDAPWDARLAPAMRERGVSVPEESMVAVLLDDLISSGQRATQQTRQTGAASTGP